MQTEFFDKDTLQQAAQLLRSGGLVVFPTETVYGLGADVFNEEACTHIFTAKGRPQDNPLICHIHDRKQLSLLARELPPGAEILMEAFWPGPLTLVLPKQPHISPVITAGLDTVGVRLPDHPAALEFLRAADTPIAAPSANRSGKPSPTTFHMAKEAMNGLVDGIIDGGDCETGLESTVVAWTDAADHPGWTILRPGAVTREDLYSVLDTLFLQSAPDFDGILAARSPGTRHPHYRPQAEVRLITNLEALAKVDKSFATWAVIAIDSPLATSVLKNHSGALRMFPDWMSLARRLYAEFHELDTFHVPGIFVQTPPGGGGIEEALRNRLLKASAGVWITSTEEEPQADQSTGTTL